MSRRKILYDVIQNGGSYIEGYQNRIDGNSIIANNAPVNYSGILIMKGDNNRLDGNSVGLGGTSSHAKIIMNGATSNNKVTDSANNSEFDNGGNNTNANEAVPVVAI